MRLTLARDLELPLDVVTQTIAILAKRRAGKSYTMRRLVEQLLKAKQQVVLIDPKGDQWGIRSSADGKGKGFAVVILGGEHGDVKIEPSSGELVAHLVVEDRVSVVIDLSAFRKSECATFMTGFLENLYRLKAQEKYRTPMMLVIDEADAVAPQKPQKGEERMLGAAEDIVRRGGQRGIGCTVVTQRSAVLNKNVLTQAQVLIALRTIAPQDLDAMKAWVDVHGTAEERRTLMASLPALEVGHAWVWSPGWPTADGIFQRVHVLPIETFDSGKSPDPGERHVAPKAAADVDLAAFKSKMAETVERAKANDPKELRRKVQELERDLAKATKTAAQPAPAKILTVKPAISDKQLEQLERVMDRVEKDVAKRLADALEKSLSGLRDQLSGLSMAIRAVGRPLPPFKGNANVVVTASGTWGKVESVPHHRHRPTTITMDGAVGGAEQRILNALAELEQLGAAQPPRELVALLANYTNLRSKGFVNALGSLRSGGFVDYPSSGAIQLQPTGRAAAVPSAAPRTPGEVQSRICSLLGGASERILRPLIDAYPNAVDRDEVGKAAGYENLRSKGFVNALGRLRTLGFVEYPAPGVVRAAAVLFLEGL